MRRIIPTALLLPVLTASLTMMAQADDPPPARPAIACLEELASLPWCELQRLYRLSAPGSVPDGFARGKVIYPPDEPRGCAKTRHADLFWRGKHFSACEGTLVNQWLGARAIHARIYPGPSWFDGQPALILDYGDTSHVWADVRDEMREVAPGLYLGAMYLRRCPEPRLKLFFALELAPPAACR